MKKLYYTILATAAALTTASCVDLLNTAPENQIASENMWTTPELALKGMNGLYETFYNRKQSNGTQVRSENLDGLNKYGIEALGFCTDYYANNYPIYQLYNQAKRANDWQLAHEWRFCYTIVHAANAAVTNLHKAGLAAQTRQNGVGPLLQNDPLDGLHRQRLEIDLVGHGRGGHNGGGGGVAEHHLHPRVL